MKAVTTQERRDKPPRSAAMRGNAVLTMLESSAANNMASSAPDMTTPRFGGLISGRWESFGKAKRSIRFWVGRPWGNPACPG